MTITQILQSFARDTQLHAAGLLIAADVIFGVLAAVKTRTFQLARIADTLKDDVLAKLLPWFAAFALAKVAPNAVDIGGLDLGVIADLFWGGLTLALAASILKSISDLGVKVPPALAGQSASPPPAPPAPPPV